MIPGLAQLPRLLPTGPLLAASLLALALPACGDAAGDAQEAAEAEERRDSLGRVQSAAERHLTDELAALLPGVWRQAGSDDALEITLLGQDAVTGDLALLVEVGPSGALHPARVALSETQALVEFTDDGTSWSIDALEEDRLILLRGDSLGRRIYQRAR